MTRSVLCKGLQIQDNQKNNPFVSENNIFIQKCVLLLTGIGIFLYFCSPQSGADMD